MIEKLKNELYQEQFTILYCNQNICLEPHVYGQKVKLGIGPYIISFHNYSSSRKLLPDTHVRIYSFYLNIDTTISLQRVGCFLESRLKGFYCCHNYEHIDNFSDRMKCLKCDKMI